MISNVAHADVERIFADWGEEAQLVETQPEYDVDAGLLTEAEYVYGARIIPGRELPSPRKGVDAIVPLAAASFLVRASEIPAHVPLTSARLRWRGRDYRIQSATPAQRNGLIVLDCETA